MSWVFAATGVHPPAATPEHLDGLCDRWVELSRRAEESVTTTREVVSKISAANAGAGVNAFTAKMGSTGTPSRLAGFQPQALNVGKAHAAASNVLRETTNQMQTKAAEIDANVRRALNKPDPKTPMLLFTLLKTGQQELRSIDAAAAQAITDAYQNLEPQTTTAADAPDAASAGNDRGDIDPRVAEEWKNMSEQERKYAAQAIVNEQFRKYGLEPHKIVWNSGLSGNGQWTGSEIEINPNKLYDPKHPEDTSVLHTLAHEVRHAAQHQAVADKNSFLASLTGKNDPKYLKDTYDATPEEVDSWKDNFDHRKEPPSNTGPDASPEEKRKFQEYLNQPVEVDARESGRNFVESLKPGDLKKYENQGKVDWISRIVPKMP